MSALPAAFRMEVNHDSIRSSEINLTRVARDERPGRLRLIDDHWPEHAALSRTTDCCDQASGWAHRYAIKTRRDARHQWASLRVVGESISGRGLSARLSPADELSTGSLSNLRLRSGRCTSGKVSLHGPGSKHDSGSLRVGDGPDSV